MIASQITPMTIAAAGHLLLLLLPFLLSLAAQGAMPKVLCGVISVLALLLSVEPYGAVLPWMPGMAIAVIAVRERIRPAVIPGRERSDPGIHNPNRAY